MTIRSYTLFVSSNGIRHYGKYPVSKHFQGLAKNGRESPVTAQQVLAEICYYETRFWDKIDLSA